MRRLILMMLTALLGLSCTNVEPRNARLIWKNSDGTRDTMTVQLTPCKDHLSLHVSKEELAKVDTLCILPEFANATAGEEGSWIYPCGFVTKFKEGREGRYSRHKRHPLPILGYDTPRGFYMGYVRTYRYDVSHISLAEKDHYTFTTELRIADVEPYEDFHMDFYPLEGSEATYSGMGRLYRQMQIEAGNIVPLRERVKTRPELKYVVENPEVRIRQCWKPVPTPVLDQTPENEPMLRVKVTFERVKDIVDEMKKQGVKAELCLVGWNLKGHDGRFPTHFPPEPELGGEKALRDLISYAQENGFQIVPHICTGDAYKVSEDWNEADIAKNPDGSLSTHAVYGSGRMYDMCYKVAFEKHAQKIHDRLADMGFRGLLYNDVYSIVPPTVCHDPDHPVNSKEAQMWGYKTFEDGAKKLGGIASEGGYDHLAPILDYCLYTIMSPDYGNIDVRPMRDGYVPLWHIVYNGTILSCPISSCVNYTVKEPSVAMKQLEYGGHPTYYFYSAHRDDAANWMGGRTKTGVSKDLLCGTQQELEEAVAAIRKGCDHLAEYGHLQYEFMEDHCELAPQVFRTLWSDGTELICNYTEEPYTYKGVEVSPSDYKYFR
ncbi:MAG: hypothetical protein J6J25_08885 [Bacteroidales bacterium]|nr:hypothetical protein [Bacteroidales bacterium]